MTMFFGFIYALASLAALGCFIWGIGSAMMNGVAGSTLGEMIGAAAFLTCIALLSGMAAGIH